MTPVTGINFLADVGTNLTVNIKAGGAIIDTAGTNVVCTKPLLNAGGGGGLTKIGVGTLTLNQVNTYTGPTVVNGGTLAFRLPASSSALTLADGATGTVTVANNAWTNSVISVTNATLNLALGAVTAVPSATTAVFNTGTLNVSGTNVINITSGAGLTVGSVKLIDYTSGANRFGSGTFVLGTLPAGIQATLVDGPNDVSLNITGIALIWTASVDNIWTTNGSANWDGGLSIYKDGDAVSFTDAAGLVSFYYSVNLANNVNPAGVILDNSTNIAVTLTGVGQITGTNGILKSGTGTMVLSLSNSFSGVVSVNNGVLQLDNGGALGSTAGVTAVTGSGTVTIGDGFGAGTTVAGETITLDGAGYGGVFGQLRGSTDSTANTWAGPIVLGANNGRIGTDINGNLTVAGSITDNGNNYSVVYRPADGGTVTVAAAGHTCAGTATFCGSGGSVKLGIDNGFSTNILYVGTGTIDLHGFNQTVGGVAVYSGSGVILNNGTNASTLTINTTGTNGFAVTSSIQDGSQPISVVKEGTGRQSLNNAVHTYTGNTTVNNGELRLGATLGNTAVSVNSGASFTVNSAATVAGTITVNSGGTLSPGAATTIGVLTNTSTVTLNAGSTNWFRVNAATTLCDRLVANNVSYGGTLVVTNLSATTLTNGQVFQIVSATTPTGNFINATNVTILPNGTGMFNPATGELTVVSTGSGAPGNFSGISVSGTTLTLTVTNGSPGGPWILLESTNLLIPVAQWWTNRTGTYDGSGNLTTNILNTATNPAAFYLLK
jgi:autotransporter-associated beta strand protein